MASIPPTAPAHRLGMARWISWLPLIAAIAAILVRLPFLLRGEGFFNSDEAVEGLMVRHIREWPVFVWGQGYKGVPEVYLAWPVFALFGAGVIQLKAVTLMIWAAAVAALTKLAERWHGETAAIVAALLLVTGPPALVYWTLCANAEVALLALVIACLLLSYESSRDRAGRQMRPAVFVLSGLALWIHPIAICAVIALALTAVSESEWWDRHKWRGLVDVLAGRDMTGFSRAVAIAIHVLIAIGSAIFLVEYFASGFHAGGVTAAHPQKMIRVVAVLAGAGVGMHALFGTLVSRARALAAMAWFALGASPVGLYILRGRVPNTIITTRHIEDVSRVLRSMFFESAPIVAGVQDPFSGHVLPWWWAAAPLAALAAFAVALRREPSDARNAGRNTGAAFTVVTVAMLIAFGIFAGAYQDRASYRYFMWASTFVTVAVAAGLRFMATRSRVIAFAVGAVCLGGAVVGQVRWYRTLAADESDRQIIACLEDRGVRAATANYWIAYRLTFLADERVVVAPDDNGRYPPYADLVRAASPAVHVELTSTPLASDRSVLCGSRTLRATIYGR